MDRQPDSPILSFPSHPPIAAPAFRVVRFDASAPPQTPWLRLWQPDEPPLDEECDTPPWCD